MSLRARLIALLVALSAAGLVLLAAVTYLSQRSFLLDRVDEQAAAAAPFLARQLGEASGRTGSRGPGAGGPGPGGPDGLASSLPPGTYGELRAGGQVVARVALTYGDDRIPVPDLPARLPPGELVTVGAQRGGAAFRARAVPARFGDVVVVAIPLAGVEDALEQLLLVEVLVILAVLALLSGLAWVLVRAGLRPLEHVAATADAIAAGDLDRRVEVAGPPASEVGRLGTAFNAMLARLQTAFAEREASEARLRQFLSDASHELRTPLASVRGYAELHRMGATSGEEGTTRAMRRIEEEAARMGALVEDLLVLARMDEVREPRAELVDVADLVEDAVADARATDPARPLEPDVVDGALVRGDPDALRQVLANLLGNALVHTPAGTRVATVVRVHGDRVVVEVRDWGPGLPGDDPQALFDRFWRAEAGRERGRAGAGLGLAIVRSLVERHGGTVRAEHAEGGGARFVVELPLAGYTPGP